MPHDVDHRAILRRTGRTQHLVEHLDPVRTAHLVVDMQNGFVEQGAVVEVAEAPGVVDGINRISAALRHAGGLNVFLQYTSPAPGEWSNFVERLGPKAAAHLAAFQRQAHDWQLCSGLDATEDDLIIEKRRFSAFVAGSSDLHEILQSRGIDTVIVTGTVTNCCCESTARDAMQLNYKVIFVPDATAAMNDDDHAAALYDMGCLFADLRTGDELVAMLEQAKAPA